jgi:hypothetical protein
LRGIVFRSGALIVAVTPGLLAGHDAPMLSIALDARARTGTAKLDHDLHPHLL